MEHDQHVSDLTFYQEWTRKLWITKGKREDDITHALFGLQTETAELTDLFKKSWFTPKRADGPPDRERIKDECGDVLYYLARLADEFQVSLVDIVEHNISKLENRYE